MSGISVSDLSKPVLHLDELGVCGHCGIVLCAREGLGELWNERNPWHCTSCGKPLTPESFGYALLSSGWRRVRWLWPDRKLHRGKPDDEFVFEGYLILLGAPN